MNKRAIVIFWGLLLAAFLLPRSARADVSEQAYADVKDVLEELITTEFADGTSAWVACHSGGLPRYYVKSLQRMHARQWGSLKTTLRDDTIDAISEYVYLSASTGPQGNAKLLSLREFIARPIVPAGPVNDPLQRLAKACATPDDADHHEAHRRAVLSAIDSAVPPSLAIEQCAESTSDNERAACSLAQALRAVLLGKDKQAQAKLIAFVMTAFHTNEHFAVSPGLRERILSGVVAWLSDRKDTQSIDTVLKAVAQILPAATPQSLFACTNGDVKAAAKADDDLTTWEVLAKMGQANAKAAAETLACAATRDTDIVLPDVKLDRSGVAYSLALDNFAASLGSLSKPETSEQLPDVVRQLLCSAVTKDRTPLVSCKGKLTEAVSANVAIGEFAWTVTVNTDGSTAVKGVKGPPDTEIPALDVMLQSAAKLRALATAVDQSINPLIATFEEKNNRRGLVRLALRLSELLHDLAELKVFAGDGDFEFTSMLTSVSRLVSTSSLLCSVTEQRCAGITELASYMAKNDGQLHDIALAVSRKDHRQLVYRVLELAFKNGADSEALDMSKCSVDHPPYAAVVLSFSSYLMNDNGSSTEQTVSKEALRTTAVHALQCASLGGLDRKWRTSDSEWDALAVFALHAAFRSASIRPSWNSAYHNQLGGDGYRTTVSLTGINAHARFTKPTSFAYAGVELSLIDYLAPLNELALRNNDTDYRNEAGIWLEIVKPRIDFMFGLPQISEHLGASAGLAMRTNAPFRGLPGQQDPNVTPPTPNTFTYLPIWSNDERVISNRGGFFELNLGVHYMF